MDRQIIEISNNGFFLSLYRGFLVIENEKKQKQEIPLDNILSLILSADNTVISKNIFYLCKMRIAGWKYYILRQKIFAINDSRAIYGTLVNVTSNKAANRLFQTIAKKFMEEYCSA